MISRKDAAQNFTKQAASAKDIQKGYRYMREISGKSPGGKLTRGQLAAVIGTGGALGIAGGTYAALRKHKAELKKKR